MLPLVEPDGSGGLLGEVLWMDHFGNAQTNVSPAELGSLGLSPGDDVLVGVGGTEYRLEWADAYGDVAEGEGLVHVDSYGQIAIAVRNGRADESFPLDTRVAVTFSRPGGGSRLPVVGSG
jgi:S-adenosylmethionine hydrolase